MQKVVMRAAKKNAVLPVQMMQDHHKHVVVMPKHQVCVVWIWLETEQVSEVIRWSCVSWQHIIIQRVLCVMVWLSQTQTILSWHLIVVAWSMNSQVTWFRSPKWWWRLHLHHVPTWVSQGRLPFSPCLSSQASVGLRRALTLPISNVEFDIRMLREGHGSERVNNNYCTVICKFFCFTGT